MKIDCTLQKKTSKNSGNEYYCIEIQLTDTYVKRVFLEPAEQEICKQLLTGLVNENPDSFSNPYDFK